MSHEPDKKQDGRGSREARRFASSENADEADREKVTLRPVESYMPPVARREWDRARREDTESGWSIGNYSASFLLGVALIVLGLVAGILIARLYMRVDNLETRLQKVEKRLPR